MKEFYVAADGSAKGGDGSFENPFSGFQQARDAARTQKDQCTIYVRVGRYFFDEPLELDERDSGSFYCAYPGEEVILTGACMIQGLTWDEDEAGERMKHAFIGKGMNIDQLYVNHKALVMARYPDYKENVLPLGGVVTEAEIKERSKRWNHPETGYIRAIHSAGWGGNDYYILGKNEQSPLGLDIEWVGDNNRGHLYRANSLLAENIREELDCEGEWFYDGESGMLSVIPYADMGDLQDLEVEVSLNTEIFRLKGTDISNVVRDIQFAGFIIENTSRTMFSTREEGKEYFPLMRGDWAVVRSGSIYLENTENITIQDCEFRNIGGNGLFFWGYNANHQICNNEFLHIGSTAIQIVGNPTAVSCPSFWEHIYYPDYQVHANTMENPEHIGPVSEEYPRDIVIRDNHIYDVGIYEKQSTGINLSVSSRISILHNTIHKSARSNINVNDGTFGGHEIAYNDIFDSQTETSDHGPFNSWGRDRFWSVPERNARGLYGDVIRHYPKDEKEYDISLLDAYQTTRIHGNRFHHSNAAVHSWGIDLDDGSSNYEIYENLCLGIGIKLREGFERKVHHNIIIDGQMQIHCTYKEARDKIYNNLFVHPKPWAFAGFGKDTEKRISDGELFVNNNFYYHENGIELPEFWKVLGFDRNAVVNINPGFRNPSENDYTVTNEQVLIPQFAKMSGQQYGKRNCDKQAPIYVRTFYTEEDLCERKWKGAVISNIDQAIMSATATAGTNGVYFQNVPEDSEAYALGYRTNQIVKQLDGKKIDNVKRFIQANERLSE